MDVGGGVKNVMKLTKSEINRIRHAQNDYGLNVASIGSPIGKVKLSKTDDGTANRYVPFAKYLDQDVNRACEMAHCFETKLIRGFSFYHPKDSDPWEHLPQVVDQLGQIAETCHRHDLTVGLEVEANLEGQTGELLAAIHQQVNHPALVLIFDAGNIITQGYTSHEVYQQYLAMKPGLGWMHIKDYHHSGPVRRGTHVHEESLKNFVPADLGDSAHETILRDFRDWIPRLQRKLKPRGIPGIFLDLEPHLKGGGQFGGFSGPDGMGVALRGLCKVLEYVGIDYHLRDFNDVRASRGF
jgi:sugar phosphate isomerase/epimerase